MTPTRRRVLAGGVTALAAGLAGCLGGTNDAEETVTDERQAANVDQLEVESTNGDATVRGSERETISVTASKRAPNEERLDELRVETIENDGTLTVTTSDDSDSGILSSLGPTPAVNFELDVPTSLTDVDIETTNGDIVAQEVDSNVIVESTNGDVTAGITEPADVTVETTNGDIELTVPPTIEAHLSLDTTNGSLDIDELDGYDATAESSVETKLGAGTHQIECDTTNGEITVQGRS